VIQASRGSEIDAGITVADRFDEKKNQRIPLEADQLIVHSTSEGTTANVFSRSGGLFSQRNKRKERKNRKLQPIGTELFSFLPNSGY